MEIYITKIVFKVTFVECLLINNVSILDEFQLLNVKKTMRMVKNLLNTPTTQNRKNNVNMSVRSSK